MMKTTHTCPLCQQTETPIPYLSARDSLVSEETFTVTRCSCCNLMVTNPRPAAEDISKYYISGDYVSHTDARRNLTEILYTWVKGLMIKRKLCWIKKHLLPLKGPALLDYGCGTGDFLRAASTQGFTARGVEPDRNARNRALKKGVMVHSSLHHLGKQDTFDVITLWHVLEHIPNTQEVLQQLYSKLRDNGLLVAAVPMANSYDADHYKSDWAAWDLPRHLYHFTPETLHAMLVQVNLQHVATYPMPFDAWYIAWLSEQQKQTRTKPATKNPCHAKPLRMLNAARTAVISNYRAQKRKSPWSSQAFVFQKPR